MRTITLWLLLYSIGIQAQSLDSFKYLGDQFSGYGYFGVAYSHGEVRNNPLNQSLSGNFMELNFKYHNFKKNRWQYDLHAKMYTDIIKQLGGILLDNETAYTAAENTGITSGPLGWHTLGFNVIGSKRLAIAPAIHANDYFYFANGMQPNPNKNGIVELVTKEPQGYYFAAGPSLMLNILPSRFLLINVKAQYSFPYWRAVSVSDAIRDDTYPFPRFFGLSTELVTPLGVYFEIDHNRLVNRGPNPNEGMRTDFNVGFKFVLD
jgi:hypothetical protein